MKIKVQENNRVYLYHILCVLAGMVALFPVSSKYVMGGELMAEWVARVEELAAGIQSGRLHLFSSAEALAMNGMDSNLWYFLPGLLYRVWRNITFVYQVHMLAVQIGTLVGAVLMFQRIFGDRETKLSSFFGILLYMTCPYRIYVCYDLADCTQAVAWMVLPFYVWAAIGLMEEGRKRDMAVAALALAGIGYADVVYFLAVAGMTVLAGAIRKKVWSFVSVAVGCIVFLPGLYRLIVYLFLDGFGELGMPLHSIMKDGYRLGQFFSSYTFRDGHPGMGLGMLACLLAGVWLCFVERERASGKCKSFAIMSVFLLILSLSCFPWDYVQRLGGWALKLVSLFGTPAIFWGMASLLFCVPAACVIDKISRHENRLVAFAVPVFVMLACYGLCVYQCNMLIYSRI